ncbi:MAG TPA: hypothetical protein VGC74_18075 [Stenotrophomonas sp.]|jgi:hypothetical protein
MKRILFLAASLLASGAALAQTDATAPDPKNLDLSLPQAPLQYRSDPVYATDPPGTYYGDKTGPAPVARYPDGRVADVVDDKLQVHGAVAAGVGYSSRGGNSNWQAATLNLSKTYTSDEGRTSNVGLNITVGQGEGDGFGFGPGYYGRGFYGPGPGWGPPPFGGW